MGGIQSKIHFLTTKEEACLDVCLRSRSTVNIVHVQLYSSGVSLTEPRMIH